MASAPAPEEPRPKRQGRATTNAISTRLRIVIASCTPSAIHCAAVLYLVFCSCLAEYLVPALEALSRTATPINAPLPVYGGAISTLVMSDSVGRFVWGEMGWKELLLIMGNIDRVFSHALNTVNKIRTGSQKPPSATRLRLYGLYKQAMGTLPRGK